MVLWMTNRERLHQFVEKQLLPAWGLELLATWWWAKITPSGHPVQPLVCFCLHALRLLYCKICQTCTALQRGSKALQQALEGVRGPCNISVGGGSLAKLYSTLEQYLETVLVS